MGETFKAKERRIIERFFEKYCKGKGLDIGHGGDLLLPDCDGWEQGDGDATFLFSKDDMIYDFVYSSHCLEHLNDIKEALKNWWRVLKYDGYLILFLPHLDLYEKRLDLPSRYNSDHKHFFSMTKSFNHPHIINVFDLIKLLPEDEVDLIYVKKCDEGHTIHDPDIHSDGEYSIEIVIRKISIEEWMAYPI